MSHQQPQPGLVDLMDYLQSRGLHRALCTRNFECVEAFATAFLITQGEGVANSAMYDRAPVMHLLQNHLPTHVFLPIITRETPGLLPKPDPAGILHIAREWGLDNRAENLIMVSQHILDSLVSRT
jgi:phosphoglycolate phosphatase-like HAD superfamily hydrolase